MRKTLLGTIAGFVAGVMVAMAMPGFAADTQDPEPVAEEKPITLVVNGQEITLPDAQPRIVDGQVMVPVLAFSEVAGFAVEWDEQTKTLHVTTPVIQPKPEPKTSTGTTSRPKTIVRDEVTWYRIDALIALLSEKYSDKQVGYGAIGIVIGDYQAEVRYLRENSGVFADASPLIRDGMVTLEELKNIDNYGR